MRVAAACAVLLTLVNVCAAARCGRSGEGRMSHLWGDALTTTDCTGPDGQPYPSEEVAAIARSLSIKRRGRKLFPTKDPLDVRKDLLSVYSILQHEPEPMQVLHRTARQVKSNVTATTAKPTAKPMAKPTAKPTTKPTTQPTTSEPSKAPAGGAAASCSGPPARLCRTRYNTTAPMYGVSLTSGKPVTIVQKFPDLLQQVIFEVCESKQCDVLHGECVQTYTPHLFLVIPLGPVTLTGQDYVLVESGCVCRPKYTEYDTALPLDAFNGQ